MMKFVVKLISATCIYLVLQASSPQLPGGDSGELLAAGCQLGVAHPPGYPLYTMIINAWSQLNIPRIHIDLQSSVSPCQLDFDTTVAWRMNSLSCILSSLAYLCLVSVSENLLTAANGERLGIFGPSIAASMFSLSPLVWEYSNTAEVFALNNFLCASLLLCTSQVYKIVHVTCRRHGGDKIIYPLNLYFSLCLGALLSGLTLTNQHSSSLLVVILVLSVLIITIGHEILNLSVLYLLSLFFVVGLSPYMYLVSSAFSPRRLSWGNMGSVSGILSHILRAEYGTFRLGLRQGPEDAIERILLCLAHSSREFFHILWPLSAVGLVWFLGLHRRKTKNKDVIKESMKTEGNKKGKMKGKKKLSGEAKESPIEKSVETKLDKKVDNEKKVTEQEPKETTKSETKIGEGRHMTDDGESERNKGLFFVVLVAWVFYQIVWHGILSNLPLASSPMAYAVHSRFWMQPLMLASVLFSLGITAVERSIYFAFGYRPKLDRFQSSLMELAIVPCIFSIVLKVLFYTFM